MTKTLYGADGQVVKKIISAFNHEPPRYDPDGDVEEMLEAFKKPFQFPDGADIQFRARESCVGSGKRELRVVQFPLAAATINNREVGTLLGNKRPRKAGYQKILETMGLRESSAFDLGLDQLGSTLSSNPEKEFLQTLGGPFSKQLYLSALLDMLAKCFWELNHNPVARRAVNLVAEYTVGRGVKFQARDQRMQAAWDEWAKRDNFLQRIWWTVRDLSWQGEVFWRLFKKADGRMTVRLLDPATIWELIADPEDVEDVAGVWQVYPGAYNIKSMMKNGEMVPYTSYTIRLIAITELLHLKVNDTYGEKRGRSDMYAGLSWFKRLRDYLTAKVSSAQYEDSFAWDMTVDGDDADVSAALNNPDVAKSPTPGSAFWHNKNVKVTPMSAQIPSRTGKNEIVMDLVRMAAATMGTPAEYLGWSDTGGTKAGGITKTLPWTKRIEMLQLWVETQLLQPFIDRMAIDYKTSGLLPRDVDPAGEFTWPEPAPEDTDVRIKRLILGKAERVLAPRDFAEMYAAELKVTDYDYDDTQKQWAEDDATKRVRGDQVVDTAGVGRPASPGSSADASAQKQNDTRLKPKTTLPTPAAAPAAPPIAPIPPIAS